MDTILKLTVVGIICGGGACALAVGLQLIVRSGPGKK